MDGFEGDGKDGSDALLALRVQKKVYIIMGIVVLLTDAVNRCKEPSDGLNQ